MTEFDPYAAWLDIPPHHQPPQPWRLLAVPPNCRDPQQLRNAANRAEQRVRQSASPEHGAWVERLCVEIRAAERAILGGQPGQPDQRGRETPLAPPTAAPTGPPTTPLATSSVSPSNGAGEEHPLSPPTSPHIQSPPPPASASREAPIAPVTAAPAQSPASQNPHSQRHPQLNHSDQPIHSPPPPGAVPSAVPSAVPGAASVTGNQVAPHSAPAAPLQPPSNAASQPAQQASPSAGPLPLGPPIQGGASRQATGHGDPWLATPAETDEPTFPEFPSQSEGPNLVVIAAVSISCFLIGVVVMLIFILLR